MPRKKLNLDKRNIRFFMGDIPTLEEHFPEIPYTAVIREIIHQYAENLRRGEQKPLFFDPHHISLEE